MPSLLDLALLSSRLAMLPARLAMRALDDLHRGAEAAVAFGALAEDLRSMLVPTRAWMDDTARTLRSIRDEAGGIRTTIEPMGRDLTILRDEFGRANDEIARLREAFGPELEALRQTAAGLHHELRQVRELLGALQAEADELGEQVADKLEALRREISALVRDAGEISDVVEPLQSATERVGRVADRLPGGNRNS